MSERCVLTLPLRTEKWQEDRLQKVFEAARKIYNALLGYELKKLHRLEHDKEYRKLKRLIYELASTDRKKTQEYKDACKKSSALIRDYGLGEFSFIADVAKFREPYKHLIGSSAASISIARPMWSAFEKYLFGNGERISFKRFDTVRSLATDGKSWLRVVDTDRKTVLTAKDMSPDARLSLLVGKSVLLPIRIEKDNMYEREMLSMPFKQIRLVREYIKGRFRYRIQFCLEGSPVQKVDTETGELLHPLGDGRVGMHINTKKLTVATKERITTYDLSEVFVSQEEEIAELQRKMDASRRSMNPENFNPDGTVKKGIVENGKRRRLRWKNSKNYFKLKDELRELHRKSSETRKLLQQRIANEIVSRGDLFVVNDFDFAYAAKRSEEDEFTDSGGYKSKKRGGKNVSSHAPAQLLDLIEQKVTAKTGEFIKVNITEYDDYENKRFDNEYWSVLLSKA